MLNASYEVWGIAIIGLLIGYWLIRRRFSGDDSQQASGTKSAEFQSFTHEHDIQHQALMFLMAQKTDSMLTALTKTIEKERQKLGVIVRKPSVAEAIDKLQPEETPVSNHHLSDYERIQPLVQNGLSISNIAQQLQLTETEISMVVRLNDA